MRKRVSLSLVTAAALSAAVVSAQNNWAHVGQDPGATKYSTLDQINTGNVKSLQKAWTFHTGDKSGFFESTPLIIDGTLYVSAQNGVFALDPLTGAEQWKFETSGATRRGLAYWPGDTKPGGRLLISSDTKLLALDMKTGKLAQEFGQGGFVEMGVTMDSPASIYKDVLITPATSPIIRAWNARTGALICAFNLIAQPGDPNHATWENDAWKTIDGTDTWGYLSIDEERGIVYIPVSIAGGDYVGAERPGNNLYGTSLVAVDIATGKRRWHQQLVHHDIWDFDLARRRRCLRPSRTASGFRPWRRSPRWACCSSSTGDWRADLRDRRATRSTEHRAGERPRRRNRSPSSRRWLATDEEERAATTISPEHTAFCAALWEKYNLQDTVPYTPWPLKQDILMFPGAVGGGNWNGVSYNKKLGLLITNVMNAGQWGHLEEVKPGDERGGRGGRGGGPPPGAPPAGPPPGVPCAGGGGGRAPFIDDGISVRSPYRKVTPEGGRFWDPVKRYPCNEPPWGELIAVSTSTGDIVWRVPLGEFEELEKKGIKTGTASLGGGITTAGDLVFIAATIDGYFRAFDARNGNELWKTKLAVPAHAIPSTYMGKDGKQYVVITAGGGGFLRSPLGDEVVAFRLP